MYNRPLEFQNIFTFPPESPAHPRPPHPSSPFHCFPSVPRSNPLHFQRCLSLPTHVKQVTSSKSFICCNFQIQNFYLALLFLISVFHLITSVWHNAFSVSGLDVIVSVPGDLRSLPGTANIWTSQGSFLLAEFFRRMCYTFLVLCTFYIFLKTF